MAVSQTLCAPFHATASSTPWLGTVREFTVLLCGMGEFNTATS